MRALTPAESAAISKARGYSKYYAFDQYIIQSGLKPEIDAKEFYAIFDAVAPAEITKRSQHANWQPTHFDTLKNMECQAKQKNGFVSILWADGRIGSDPDEYFHNGRYRELES